MVLALSRLWNSLVAYQCVCKRARKEVTEELVEMGKKLEVLMGGYTALYSPRA